LYGSKAMINACKDFRHMKTFSKRSMLRQSVYDAVAARWKELGLPGTVPTVAAYEPEPDAEKD
jgi:hypothetical protein